MVLYLWYLSVCTSVCVMFTVRKVRSLGLVIAQAAVLLVVVKVLEQGPEEVLDHHHKDPPTPPAPPPTSRPESLVRLMAMFGMRAKEAQATDPRYWETPCTVTGLDARDAINRASTEQCRRELTSVACLASREQLIPDFIPSLCDRFRESPATVARGGDSVGCFKDSFSDRVLKGFVRQDWDLNSPALCVRVCLLWSGVGDGVLLWTRPSSQAPQDTRCPMFYAVS